MILSWLRRRSSSRALLLAYVSIVLPLAARAAPPDPGPSAAEILHRVEERAKAEHKNILLDFDASWCGNCKLYDRFREDPQMRPLLSRAFVFATMDTGERSSDTQHADTPGGAAFEDSIGGKDAGWPFLVMLDANGKPLVDSNRPDRTSRSGRSNVGYPAAPEEVDWFIEMLRRGAPSLSQQDLASVHAWLTAHSPMQHH
ncbi:MAG TPA: thioredoxin family protein [Acidobacteriaceae bacterium]|nr:thioredoxin family protein [Acidobacteriaceae bacterium]